MIQTASVFPELKTQGYKVLCNTNPTGRDILRNDPNVDGLLVQYKDQVMQGDDLLNYWKALESKVDKFVNLSESIECSLLAYPGREEYLWPKAVRHKAMNVNYLERTHDIAEVPHNFHARFYPSKQEQKWARKERLRLDPRKPVILWSLSGSSYHKAYPFVDNVIARLMTETDATVVLVGDLACQILEFGWQRERRVKRRSGVWSIRQTLAFLEQADVVVGTETGVLNAAGLMEIPKVVLLSHSSPENLTKHWTNTHVMSPFRTPCWPCHRLIYTRVDCVVDPNTGGARCASEIDPVDVFNAIINSIEMRKAA